MREVSLLAIEMTIQNTVFYDTFNMDGLSKLLILIVSMYESGKQKFIENCKAFILISTDFKEKLTSNKK